MQKMTMAQLMAKIETVNTERELKRILKATRARMFEVRYADAPKEKAAILRTRKLMTAR